MLAAVTMTSLFRLLILPLFLMTTVLTTVGEARAVDPETAKIYQIRLSIRTCDREHAGTNGMVTVRLDTFAQRFSLDLPINDRQRNSFDHYGLTIPTLDTLGEITRIQFDLVGNDAWCIDDIFLTVNGNVVFAKVGLGIWLDNDDSRYPNWHRVETHELRWRRHNQYWPTERSGEKVCQVPADISMTDMKRTLDAMVGHLLRTENDYPDKVERVTWGGNSQLSRASSSAWRYSIKLRAKIKGFYDADIIARYAVRVSCDGSVDLTSTLYDSEVKFDLPDWLHVVAPFAMKAVHDFIAVHAKIKLNDALEGMTWGLDESAPPISCMLDSAGALNFVWPSILPKDPLCE